MKETILYLTTYVFVFGVIIGVSVFVSKKTERFHVINPEPDIKCVVVSKAFNTSVDCWRMKE